MVDNVDIETEEYDDLDPRSAVYVFRHIERVVRMIEDRLDDSESTDSMVIEFAPWEKKPEGFKLLVGKRTRDFIKQVRKMRRK